MSGNKDHSPALLVSGDKQGAVTGKSVNHTAQQEAGQAMGRGRGRSSALKEVGGLLELRLTEVISEQF